MVEQVEEIPASTNVNSVFGNRCFKASHTIGRYPFISVIEPPMKATRPFLPCSNWMRELLRLPRHWTFPPKGRAGSAARAVAGANRRLERHSAKERSNAGFTDRGRRMLPRHDSSPPFTVVITRLARFTRQVFQGLFVEWSPAGPALVKSGWQACELLVHDAAAT